MGDAADKPCPEGGLLEEAVERKAEERGESVAGAKEGEDEEDRKQQDNARQEDALSGISFCFTPTCGCSRSLSTRSTSSCLTSAKASLRGQGYYLRSYRRIVLLLLHNYFEIIFWFAASYLVLAGQFSFEKFHGSLVGVIYSSFAVMTNIGSAGISARTLAGLYVLWVQSLVGLFMTLVSLARFISILPAPRTLEEKEDGKGRPA
ncbi:MAG: hypothetical protein QHH75_05455 [Bacillota bacterium]|nr:hypothetical protein [Bacillota bacterium]